jgi:NAD(P)-dependent dehydrogenase (short-subunit alcohol dehydrogenase family)
MGRLAGKVALLAGSATGMGKATAARMAREGARVVLADINLDAVLENARDISAAGGDAVAVRMDIANESEVCEGVEFALKSYGRIDVLQNYAAAFQPEVIGEDSKTDLLNLDLKVYDATMSVNLRGFVLTCKYVVPHMIEAGGGSIINTSSIAGLYPEPIRQAYSISKAGVNMLTLSIATVYGRRGIRCNAICPGLVMSRVTTGPYIDLIRRHTLTPFAGQPEDIADLSVFLASDESRYITGSIIRIDGGVLAKSPFASEILEHPSWGAL